MFTGNKKAVVSVINDLVTDNRVLRICDTLQEAGYSVTLIGRRLKASPPLPVWNLRAVRMKLFFTRGPLFYLFFNLRLFLKLLFVRADLFYANDLDTLLPNYLAARMRGKTLIYDSHELFCEVPELQNSPLKKKMWLALEGRIIPKLKHCITVNESIASLFTAKYGTPFAVVRNIGNVKRDFVPRSRESLGLPEHKKIIIMQGAGINIDRGAEELMEAMVFVDNALLLIIGSGDVWKKLEEKMADLRLAEKVRLIGRLPSAELRHYTCNADLGVSIDKNSNANYRYSLPNKIFDYIHAGVPILASRLPEPERIISEYRIGVFIDNHDPEHIARVINELFRGSKLQDFRANTLAAATAFTWEHEKTVLLRVIRQAAG